MVARVCGVRWRDTRGGGGGGVCRRMPVGPAAATLFSACKSLSLSLRPFCVYFILLLLPHTHMFSQLFSFEISHDRFTQDSVIYVKFVDFFTFPSPNRFIVNVIINISVLYTFSY